MSSRDCSSLDMSHAGQSGGKLLLMVIQKS